MVGWVVVGWVARSKTQQLTIKAMIDLGNIVAPKVQAVAQLIVLVVGWVERSETQPTDQAIVLLLRRDIVLSDR